MLVVLTELMLRRTRYGRHLLASGSNPETAVILGIRTGRVKTIAFTLVGALAGVAGPAADDGPRCGQSRRWEPRGHCSRSPRSRSAAPACSADRAASSVPCIGVVTLQTISNGIVSVGLDTNWQTFAIGVLMVSIVSIDILRRRRLAGR